ncbi:MAG: hypothetical protein R2762_10100 [Bryobacteraceae bacterium]
MSSDNEASVAAEFPNNRLKAGTAAIGPVHDAAGNGDSAGGRGRWRYDGEEADEGDSAAGVDGSLAVRLRRRRGAGVHHRHTTTPTGGSATVLDEMDYLYDAGGQLLAEYTVARAAERCAWVAVCDVGLVGVDAAGDDGDGDDGFAA